MLKNNIFNLTKRYFCTPFNSKIELLTKDNKKCNLYYHLPNRNVDDSINQEIFCGTNIENYFNDNYSNNIKIKDIKKLFTYEDDLPMVIIDRGPFLQNIINHNNKLSYKSKDNVKINMDYSIKTRLPISTEQVDDIIKDYINNIKSTEINVYELRNKIDNNLHLKNKDISLNINYVHPMEDIIYLVAITSIILYLIYNDYKLNMKKWESLNKE
tara:strand:+ start:12 stop:650 length:639 start_codon:yes stop_codon:yes gene_type:complete